MEPSKETSSLFEVRPSIIHFGSYRTHKVHTQIVEVTNISSDPIRLSFTPPKHEEFSLGVPSNKSFLVRSLLEYYIFQRMSYTSS